MKKTKIIILILFIISFLIFLIPTSDIKILQKESCKDYCSWDSLANENKECYVTFGSWCLNYCAWFSINTRNCQSIWKCLEKCQVSCFWLNMSLNCKQDFISRKMLTIDELFNE